MEELELVTLLKEVYVRNVNCADRIEKLYYSAGYDPICIYCATHVIAKKSEYYPQCSDCKQLMVKKKYYYYVNFHYLFSFVFWLSYFIVLILFVTAYLYIFCDCISDSVHYSSIFIYFFFFTVSACISVQF